MVRGSITGCFGFDPQAALFPPANAEAPHRHGPERHRATGAHTSRTSPLFPGQHAAVPQTAGTPPFAPRITRTIAAMTDSRSAAPRRKNGVSKSQPYGSRNAKRAGL